MTNSEESSSSTETADYRHSPGLMTQLEGKWQTYRKDSGTFCAPGPAGDLTAADGLTPSKDELFVQDVSPHPSSAGLHVGHPLDYIIAGVFARFHHM